ncbi:MAG: hypothetical protein C0483_17895 [Pirellula sp.]|nr:hypothetical protein [Pirellula sp.]
MPTHAATFDAQPFREGDPRMMSDDPQTHASENSETPPSPPPMSTEQVMQQPPPLRASPPVRHPPLRLCTHNPFYVLSASLVVYGLFVSFPVDKTSGGVPLLALSLATYVLLLGGTAWILRRLGVLWEDLRMLGLLAVLLLPMVSVGLDAMLQSRPDVGRLWSIGGALFAVVVGEALLRGLRVRLPVGYRVPYHLLMTFFFLYPPLVQARAIDPRDLPLQWLLFGFATAAAAILLMLAPAVWQGPAYVSQSGTPWSWPWYPLTIFVPIVLCVAGRAYYLCEAFHAVDVGQSIFGFYFLSPLLLVIGALFLIGRRHASGPFALRVGLALPAVAVLITSVDLGPAGDPAAREFLGHFRAAYGTLPPLAVLCCAVAYYGTAALLRVPRAYLCFNAALAAAAFAGPDSNWWADRSVPTNPWPLLVAGALLYGRGLMRGEVAKGLLGALCWGLFVVLWSSRFPAAPALFFGYHLVVVLLVLLATRTTGDRRSLLTGVVALMILFAGIEHTVHGWRGLFMQLPATAYNWYLPAVFLFTASSGYWLRDPWLTTVSIAMLLGVAGRYGLRSYLWLKTYVAGLDAIAAGLALFVAAVGVSLGKRRRPPPVANVETVNAEQAS